GAHPHGRGHEKQLPAASGHGQETAGAHKKGGQRSVGSGEGSSHGAKSSHPTRPAHPPHPAKPSPPSFAADKAPPVEGSASPAGSKGGGATQGDLSAEEPGAQRETGR
ncbi:MAG: hypothetical protein ACLGG5_00310, partial [Thermoleophilia bacterium]